MGLKELGLRSPLRGNSLRVLWRGSQVVRQRSAKPLFAGSIPARASSFLPVGAALRRFHLVVAVAIVVTAASACDRGPKIGPPNQLSKLGDQQTAVVGKAVSVSPAVVIVDANGRGVPGIAVTFSVASGGGSVQSPTAQTDESGTASAGTWTLGTIAGQQTLTAAATDVPGSPASFTATAVAGPTTSLTKVGSEPITSPIGANIDSIAVQATDQYGNPVPNELILFSVTAGGGSVSPASRPTGTDGRAAARWTIGPELGATNTAKATENNASLSVAFSTVATNAVSAVRFADHVLVVDSGSNITPSIVVLDAKGSTIPDAPISIVARNLSVANGGATVTGSRSGQTFVVATSLDDQSVRDSAMLLVSGGGKPVVSLDVPRFDLKTDTTFTVSLRLDPRSTSVPVGSATLQVVWNTAVLTFVSEQAVTTSNVIVDLNSAGIANGVITVAMASSAGVTGTTELRRFTFKASSVVSRSGTLSVQVVDLAAAGTFVNLAAQTVSGSYPLRIR